MLTMPKMVQIRNVPDRLHRTLKARAADAGLSLSDYLLRELREVAERPPLHEVLDRARRRPLTVAPDEIVDALESGRSGR